ncbi:MAG: hypothetical protein EXS08_10180 [Planctomycetes bacterium]|nr:hypothetical protein [Planctomycetota bacterium]
MRAAALAAGLGLLLAAAGPRAEERELERRFASELELATDDFELSASEEGRTVEQSVPHYGREEATELETVDTLFDDEVPPAKFVRLYRAVTSSSRLSGGKKDAEAKTVSAGLEQKRVTFERDEEGQYARSCDDADVRPGQLKRLRADLSLAELLAPTRAEDFALEPGASFELTGADCLRLFSPVEEGPRRARAKVGRTKRGLDFAPAALTEPLPALFAGLEGTLTATLRAHADDDELPLNATLEFELESAYDGSKGLVAEGTGEAEDELTLTYAGTGTLAWDPDSGRVELELRGELHLSEEFRVRIEANGKTAEINGKLAMTGDFTAEAHEAPVE